LHVFRHTQPSSQRRPERPLGFIQSLHGHMARIELYPLSISEITGNPRNLVGYLLAGEFHNEAPVTCRREQIAAWILQGGYPDIQGKSTRAQSLWFRSYVEGRLFKDFASLHAARGDYQTKLKTIIGMECKASASVNLGDFKGLRALAAAAGKRLQQGVLIYSGEHVLPFKVENRKFFAVPIGLFLTADKKGLNSG